MDSTDAQALTRYIKTMAPIVAGLKQALRVLDLDDAEREVLANIFNRYGSVYKANRSKLKKIKKNSTSNKIEALHDYMPCY